MARPTAPSKAVTPPKGRPTRGRRPQRSQRTFGSTFQWTAAAAGLVALLLAGFFVFG